MPNLTKDQIHTENSTDFSVWTEYREDIISLYNTYDRSNLDDHVTREFNRKVTILGYLSLLILPSDSGGRYIGTNEPTDLWTPSEITTSAWYDVLDSSTLTESNNFISQLNDKSGNDNHLIQTEVSNQPPIGSINGNNAINILNRRWLEAIAINQNLSEFAIISVQRFNSGSFANIFRTKSSDDLDSITVRRRQTGDNLNNIVIIDGDSSQISTSNVGLGVNHVYAVTYNSSIVQNRINGKDDTSLLKTGVFSLDEIRIGWITNGGNDSTCGEFIIVPTSNISDIQRLEGYVAWKWGIQNNLDANHPYKLFAPKL